MCKVRIKGLNAHICVVCSVSQSIQAINEAVDSGDAAQTLAALRSPGAGLYGVTSECAQTYQDDLAKIKDEKKEEGQKKMSYSQLLNWGH